MASNEVTISRIPVSQQAWPERLRELVCRFLSGPNAPSVGSITITPPTGLAGTTTALVECFNTADAAAITADINAMTASWYGMQLSAVQGTDS